MLDQLRKPLAATDAWLNRLYGWKNNPLYHSGVLAASLLAVAMVTGLYLIFFWGISDPFASVEHITNRVFLGRFTRSLHRYASDAAILAALVHLVRVWLQRRTWGPRALAWITGFFLLGTIWILGWTGYVMVWDIQGEVLAREGARWMDALPLFSEPISRAFDGERALPGAFFFLNLFAHVALPVGLGVVFWLHVARVARPQLVPPKQLLWGVLGLLALASVVVPVTMDPPADLFRLPGRASYDVFYAFFLPLTRPLAPWAVWVVGGGLLTVTLLVPALTKPKAEHLPPPSVVDERSCTGCEQCWLDCPYEAIRMVERTDGGPYLVARVDPDLCTSCGICAGSCAPMGVGPAGRTGKDQLADARRFVAAHPYGVGDVVIVTCRRAGGIGARTEVDGAPVFTVSCAGNLHSSVIEFFVRGGAGGVLIAACPPRDCWSREGPIWLEQRLFHDREAALRPRVEKRRVRVVHAGEGEPGVVRAALAAFRAEVWAFDATVKEEVIDLARGCEADEATSGTAAGEAVR
ncbi:MAG: cytochrome b N-terminal domain-containing protein [Gemmatimonadota bacterium]